MLILNKKTDTIPRQAIYIGRGSALGNPYAIGEAGTREEVIAAYESHINKELDDGNPIITLKMMQLSEGCALVCYCKPQACHGDIIEKVWRERFKDFVPARTLFYAGIGSRSAPDSALGVMTKLAARLGELRFVLRSGRAAGADTAFEDGAKIKEIFLPWRGFRGSTSVFESANPEAFRLAEQLHPAWAQLGDVAKKLMARNSHQILGANLRSPIDFVACWTPDGAETAAQRGRNTGGTGQAIELANRFGIPVFNLKNEDAMARLSVHIQSHPSYQPRQEDARCRM